MTSPLPHHNEDIPDPDVLKQIDAALAAYRDEFAGSGAARLAEKLVPEVPDGGRIGRALTPHVPAAIEAGSTLRRWAPATVGSVAVTVAVVVVPLPRSLDVYAIGLAGYGWWHCCGRPGPIAWVRLILHHIGDVLAPLSLKFHK